MKPDGATSDFFFSVTAIEDATACLQSDMVPGND